MAGAEWAMENQHHTAAVGCTIAAANVWLHTGPFAAGASLVERCLQIDALPTIDRHRLHQILGELWSVAGHGSISLPHLNTALKLAKSLRDLWFESNVLNNLGGLYAMEGHFEDSKTHLLEALAIAEQGQHADLAARAKRNLAVLHREIIGEKTYLDALEAALQYSQSAGDRSAEALNLANLAVAQGELGDVDAAETHFFASLTIYRELGNRRMMHIAEMLGNLYKQQGRLKAARHLYETAIVGLREVGDRRAAGGVLSNLGNALSTLGDLEGAAQSLREGIEIGLEIGNPRLVAIGRGNLGDILLKQGQLDDARQLLILAIDFCKEAFPVPAGAFMGSLALVESQEGRIPSALTMLDQAESLIGSSNQQERAKLLCKRGRVLRMVPDANRAIESLREAEQIQQAIEAGDESELGKAVNELRMVLHNPTNDGI